jgi:hypothetical protein
MLSTEARVKIQFRDDCVKVDPLVIYSTFLNARDENGAKFSNPTARLQPIERNHCEVLTPTWRRRDRVQRIDGACARPVSSAPLSAPLRVHESCASAAESCGLVLEFRCSSARTHARTYVNKRALHSVMTSRRCNWRKRVATVHKPRSRLAQRHVVSLYRYLINQS